MRLTSFNITVAAAAVFIVHTTCALPAFSSTPLNPISPSVGHMLTSIAANGQEARSLSNHILATNASFPTNLTNEDDITYIEQCGDDKRTVERARNLARAAVNVARVDATRGTGSPHGFTAMFKEDVLKYTIAQYLNEVYESRGLRGLRPDPEHATSPRFVCVQPNSATVYKSLKLGYDPWVRCHNRETRHPAYRNAFYTFGTAYIFLCPRFLNQALAPLGNHCPTVSNNVFVGSVGDFYRDYQMYQLLYQLMRFYLQRNTLRLEIFGWNQCVEMDGESSAKNPTNFLLYIACKSNLFFLCSITSVRIWTQH